MVVYELSLKVYCLENIKSEEALEKIAKLIDKSFLKDEDLSKIHHENTYKYYTFNSLYPIEKDKVYKKGKIYSILIRTLNEKLKNHLISYLANESTEYIKGLTIESRVIKKRFIEKIYNISPAVAKFEDGYWRRDKDLDVIERRLTENLIKKYNKYNKISINEDVDIFRFIKIENIKPIASSYKGKSILGDKFTLEICENNMAQNLAYFALGSGILEMNSRGFGFVNCSYVK